MDLAFIDISAVGSPIDVATFIFVLATFVYELRPRSKKQAAAVVGLARQHREVDDDRLQDELDVDEDAVEAIRTTIVNEVED